MRFEDIGKPLSGIPTSNEQNELARHPLLLKQSPSLVVLFSVKKFQGLHQVVLL